MAKGKIIIHVDGASQATLARMANDVWARLSDPTHGVSLTVCVEGDVTVKRLDRDYEDRYRGAGDWT